MRPIFGSENHAYVITDYGFIPWDAKNDRPLDWQAKAGRDHAQALAENGMKKPDSYVVPDDEAPLTPEQKLERAGLTIADLEYLMKRTPG